MIPKGASMNGYDAKAVSVRCSSPGGGETLTQQHFAEDADINTIVRRFGLTGQLPQMVSQGVYADFSGVTDFDSALETIAGVEARFMKLPPEVREKFGNDAGQLVRYADDHSETELNALFGKPVVPADVGPVLPAVEVVV